jgi:hypothetical protein
MPIKEFKPIVWREGAAKMISYYFCVFVVLQERKRT